MNQERGETDDTPPEVLERLAAACAFTEACNAARVEHVVRGEILRKAGGLSGIGRFLASSERGQVLNELFAARYQSFDARGKEDIRVTTIADHDYPVLLKEISSPPAVLFWKGRSLEPLSGPFVIAVIGSRHPSVYGLEVTRHLVSCLSRRGVPVVSGGARGVDGEAHRTALHEGGWTFSVLGCGVDVVYPAEHRDLFREIVEHGALLSEYLPGSKPRRSFFPARNRIISGLCHALLVTEASKASGTLITASYAADQGRDVCAVPGSIIAGSSHSCHQLIREGAVLVESLSDIPNLDEMAPSRVIGERLERTTSDGRENQDKDALCKGAEDREKRAALNKIRSRDQAAPSREIGDRVEKKTSEERRDDSSRSSSCGRSVPTRSPEETLLLELLEAAPRSLSLLAERSRLGARKTALLLSKLQREGDVKLYRGVYQRVHF